MNVETPAAMRRFWLLLWTLALGLILVMLFATLPERAFDPEAVRHFPAEVLQRGRQFSREARIAGTLEAIASLATMLWLCFHPAGSRLLRRLEEAGRGRLWLGLLAVAGGISLLTTLVELPFAFYLGYLHEKAYGLTQQTPGDWLWEYGKSLLVGFVISYPLWGALYWLIRRWPRGWWAPAAVLSLAFYGLVALLYPVVLMPLFNDLEPVKDPWVLQMVQNLADRAGVEVEQVQEMRVSDKTSRVNAMVTGLGPTKQVIVYDTMLQQFRPEEVEVVLAHELAHAINQDVAVGWLVGGAASILELFIAAWMLRSMCGCGPLRMQAPHAPRSLALIMLLGALFGQVTAPVENVVSRRAEVRADKFALEITGNPRAFISGFKKLASGNPGDVDPPALVEFLSHSHPSITSRVRAAAEALQGR